ncbi:SRPBCC family protein [Nocardia sp. 2]|uniref:SRPBCC family protein n=1 Tax=Nocardia acididurans TaxID=2802282 RepID=A0ABS1M2H4_9NOCA|nr:SRPBCC family protein [Nocardia acididurans]MBL1074857.1 SRPBCC family protein [Nocardia acididurans]
MVHIHHRGESAVPADFAFEYMADFTNMKDWLYGMKSVTLVGDVPHMRPGALYEGVVKIGATLKATIKLTELVENRVVATESVKGFSNQTRWVLEELGPEQSALTVDIHYQLPGGLAGKALGAAMEPFVAVAVKWTETRLREALETRYRASKAAV